MEQKPDQKIKAFTLKKKTSKAGKVYYISPYGEVDLFAFESREGDIVCYYSPRTGKPQGQANSPSKPAITPRPQQPTRPQGNYRPQNYAPQSQGYKDHTQGGFPNTEDGDPGPNPDDYPNF